MEIYSTQNIIVTTLHGLEEVLEKDLHFLGIKNTEKINRGVAIPFSQRNIYLSNMACRVALRVLVPVFSFEANDVDELYRKSMNLPWEKFQDVDQTFAIFKSVNSSIFTHGQYAALKIKDALCDHYRKKMKKRPDVDTHRPDIYWNVHIFENKVTISLDSSGESLHIRGYRRGHHGAPINEVLACGLLYLSEWDSQFSPLVDGMTGSGTIAIEAALMAARRAPNLNRKNFPFRKWKDFDEALYQDIRTELMQKNKTAIPEIMGIDISPRAIQTAKIHAGLAGVQKMVKFIKKDVLDFQPEKTRGFIILNPPYGERMEEENLDALYRELGISLKHHFTGWKAGIISSSKSGFQNIGLNSYQTNHLLNGKLECNFKMYELFEGKKKDLPGNE